MRQRLKDMLIRHEGIRYIPYQDAEGHWTIGVGHKIGNGLSKEVVMLVLDEDMDWVLDCCAGLPYWPKLNEARRIVVANMMFNLGVAGFQKHKKFRARLEAEQWAAASEEMLQSKWAAQVGRRAEELAEIMRAGKLKEINI